MSLALTRPLGEEDVVPSIKSDLIYWMHLQLGSSASSLTVQSDSQLRDLTDPLLLLRNRRPDELLKLPVEDGDGFCAATLGGELPDASDGGARLLAPELILLKCKSFKDTHTDNV